MKLYKRDGSGSIRCWEIEADEDKQVLRLSYGLLCGGKINETVPVYPKGGRSPLQQLELEYASRINKQRKAGYRQYVDYVVQIQEPTTEAGIREVLQKYMPDINYDINGYTKPMLAKRAYVGKVPFGTINYIAQPKINGLRCTIKFIKNPALSLFSTHEYEPIFISRGGELYTVNHFKEYLLNTYPQAIMKDFCDVGIELDGEFYIPGLPINEINSAVRNASNPNHKKVQFWMFDLVHPELSQLARFTMMDQVFELDTFTDTIDSHLNNKNKFVTIERISITNDTEMEYYRDLYIDRGFEGIILRDTDGVYQYGKRNNTMLKFKTEYEKEFLIVDVVPEGESRAYMGKFICKNDVNDETFKVTINCTVAQAIKILSNKDRYIGRMVNVVYRERSGKGAVPFHAKARILRDELEIIEHESRGKDIADFLQP